MKYKVGDIVKIKECKYAINRGTVGWKAKIIKINPNEFDYHVEYLDGFKDISGEKRDYYNEYELEHGMNSNGGLIPEEKEIADRIISAWNKFVTLEQSHPDDIKDFLQGVHIIQKVLGMRVLRRYYPDYWLNKSDTKTAFKQE